MNRSGKDVFYRLTSPVSPKLDGGGLILTKRITGLYPRPVIFALIYSLWSPSTLDEYKPRAAPSPFDLWHGDHPLLRLRILVIMDLIVFRGDLFQ